MLSHPFKVHQHQHRFTASVRDHPPQVREIRLSLPIRALPVTYKREGEGRREGETDRQTDRQTHRHTDTQTDRQTDRHNLTGKRTGKQRDRLVCMHAGRQPGRRRARESDRQ